MVQIGMFTLFMQAIECNWLVPIPYQDNYINLSFALFWDYGIVVMSCYTICTSRYKVGLRLYWFPELLSNTFDCIH